MNDLNFKLRDDNSKLENKATKEDQPSSFFKKRMALLFILKNIETLIIGNSVSNKNN